MVVPELLLLERGRGRVDDQEVVTSRGVEVGPGREKEKEKRREINETPLNVISQRGNSELVLLGDKELIERMAMAPKLREKPHFPG